MLAAASGSASNLMSLKRAGLEMINASYRGTAPALTDLIAGHPDHVRTDLGKALQARAGLIRMLAA